MAEVSKRCSLCELWGLNCTLHCFYSLSTSTSLFSFHLSLFSSFLQGSFTLRPLLRDADSLLLLKSSAFPHRWNERQVKANGNRQLRSLLPSRQQHLTRSPKVVACHLSLPTAKRGARSVSKAIAPWGMGDTDESCNIPTKLFQLTFRMWCHLQNWGFGGM